MQRQVIDLVDSAKEDVKTTLEALATARAAKAAERAAKADERAEKTDQHRERMVQLLDTKMSAFVDVSQSMLVLLEKLVKRDA
jgi:hypothetical protein